MIDNDVEPKDLEIEEEEGQEVKAPEPKPMQRMRRGSTRMLAADQIINEWDIEWRKAISLELVLVPALRKSDEIRCWQLLREISPKIDI